MTDHPDPLAASEAPMTEQQPAGSDPGLLGQAALRAAQKGDWPEVERLCCALQNARPDDPFAHTLRQLAGAARQEVKNFSPLPEAADAMFRQSQFGAAARHCRAKLEDEPGHPGATVMLAQSLIRQGDFQSGLTLLQDAMRESPLTALYHGELSKLYCVLNDPERALAAARFCHKIGGNPQNTLSLGDIAYCLYRAGQVDEAVDCCLEILAIEPTDGLANFTLGILLIERGEYEAAFRHLDHSWRRSLRYQYANLNPSARADGMPSDKPLWSGLRLKRGTILLIADQGAGDMIQFSRYVPMVAELVGKVVLVAPSGFASLFARIPGVESCAPIKAPLPPHDVWCSLSRLPLLFGTTSRNIPRPEGYLTTDPDRQNRWRILLEHKLPRRRLRVGLAWRGNPSLLSDIQRSLELAQLDPVTSLDGIDFIALQCDLRASDRQALLARQQILDISDKLIDWDVTAAALANIDILVTVDTGIAHLSAALGRLTFLLSYLPTEWRWHGDAKTSPWYRAVLLFRQQTPGLWQAPIEEVASVLREIAARYSAPPGSPALTPIPPGP